MPQWPIGQNPWDSLSDGPKEFMTDESSDTSDTSNTSDTPAPDEPSTTRDRRQLPPWLVPMLIGLVTITAGLFTWRAGQLASSAAYEDRQAVGQTIKQENLRVEAGLATVNQAVAYVDYAADFAEAAALDSTAAELVVQGLPEVAADVEGEADVLRLSATDKAAAVGVFGEQAILDQAIADPDKPIPFDLDEQLKGNQAAVGTGIASPGVLDPDRWAEAADDTRQRVRLLRWDTLLLLLSVLAFTVAQLAPRRSSRRIGFAVGSVVYLFVTVATFLGSF